MRYFTLVCCLIMLPLVGLSQKKETLRGLDEFQIVIEDLASDAREIGLTRSDLQREVELKLRLAGIRVIKTAGASPYLYLNVNVLNVRGGDAYNALLAVQQLVRCNGDLIDGSTWRSQYLGIAP